LASGVAHEINNPIQGIMNYAELILDSPAADETICDFASEVRHETERVATIVRNLLAFSRQEQHSQQPDSVSVRALVEGTLSLIRSILRKDHIHLDLAIPETLPLLRCRPQQIQQVLMNLVINARDALNQRFSGYSDQKQISIRAEALIREDREWLRIRVDDRGGGVPEHVVRRIFDPFFTTKGRDQGTGLGLAVSHGIVAEHGGRLTLENRPGHGASFVIELAAASEDS